MDIYEQHDKAFAQVSAYVITKDGERVGTIAFKFPRDGAGRLWCYIHHHGEPMNRGYAGGYGYDKKSAAAHSASKGTSFDGLILDQGSDWSRDLEEAGFNVYQAI